MSKRYRDTEIWGKEWYVSLSCAERNAVDYVLCRCDAVGVWPPAFSVAERLIGEAVDWPALPGKTNGNIVVLDNGKWFVTDFVEFQYGKLRESCAPHRCYLALLEKHGLDVRVGKGFQGTHKEKEKEKEKELEKERGTLYHAVEKAFLSKNDDKFSNYGKEGKAIHALLDKAQARSPDDPASLLRAMLDAFWRLKTTDTGAKGFWRDKPFLPSALSSMWDHVLETMRADTLDPEILAIIKGGAK